VKLTVNGEPREIDGAWGGESLLYALRERLGLPGSKNACEQGECGSCSVYLDGTLVCACLVLAAQAEGRDVVTVEGLAPDDTQRTSSSGTGDLHEIQQAFIETGAVQCGFCTPGLVVASHDLLRRDPRPTEADIREALAGNVCRCTGYAKIVDAVQLAAERLAGPA
jgi:carbon-monoxide dehydrogenase small subunit